MEKQIGWPVVLVDWGAEGVQLYMLPGTGLRWAWVCWGWYVLVMERIRRRSLPDWSMFVFGWQRIFFHAVLGGILEKQMGWPLVWVSGVLRGSSCTCLLVLD